MLTFTTASYFLFRLLTRNGGVLTIDQPRAVSLIHFQPFSTVQCTLEQIGILMKILSDFILFKNLKYYLEVL